MKKNEPSTIPRSRSILYFALTLIFLPFFVNNASARHTETKVGWAANGIASSLHNLSTSGPLLANPNDAGLVGNANSGKGTTEMCVYCHTPHFADRSKGPLWNRYSQGGPIEGYGTTIAKNVDGNANMFSSLACLSCHDGVTTFDNLINQPGKDTATNGVNLGDQPSTSAWKFKMGNSFPNGTYKYDHFGEDTCTLCHDVPGGLIDVGDNPIPRLIIGENAVTGPLAGKTNLSNDHPIGVLYRGNGDANASASLRARTVNISDINMDIETENSSPMAALVTGNLWAVKGFISNSATIQDLLRSGTGQGSGNYVQCTSCHDAHFKNQTNPEKWNWSLIRKYGTYDPPSYITTHDAFEVNGLFLRRVGGNSDSGLCRTCHDKG